MTHTLPVTGNTQSTRPENRAFFPALDGMRAIAFIMVFLVHYASLPWGWAGVNVFFVLSGFLITGILFDSRDDPHRVRNFYIRRTLRIFPLYYGILVLLLLLDPLLHWKWSAAWITWPLYLGNYINVFTQAASVPGSALQAAGNAWLWSHRFPNLVLTLGHFWSLCVEEQFYLIWPWIVFSVRNRRTLLWICAVVTVVEPFLRQIAEHTLPQWMIAATVTYRATPFQLDALLVGGLVSLLWRGAHRDRLVLIARVVAAALAVAAVIYLARTLHLSNPDWAFQYRYPSWWLSWGLTFVNLFTASAIVCVLRPAGFLYRFLSLRPLRWLGRISYGAYVFHDIFHYLFSRIFSRLYSIAPFPHGARTASVLFAFGCTLLLSWLSFRFYESPFLNLKERLTIRSGDPRN